MNTLVYQLLILFLQKLWPELVTFISDNHVDKILQCNIICWFYDIQAMMKPGGTLSGVWKYGLCIKWSKTEVVYHMVYYIIMRAVFLKYCFFLQPYAYIANPCVWACYIYNHLSGHHVTLSDVGRIDTNLPTAKPDMPDILRYTITFPRSVKNACTADWPTYLWLHFPSFFIYWHQCLKRMCFICTMRRHVLNRLCVYYAIMPTYMKNMVVIHKIALSYKL